jgi:hypothetical protein
MRQKSGPEKQPAEDAIRTFRLAGPSNRARIGAGYLAFEEGLDLLLIFYTPASGRSW